MNLSPEQIARQKIDVTLEASGWVIQDMQEFSRNAALGVAVREFQLPAGPCDYLLFVDGKANVLFFYKRPASKEVQTEELWVYGCRTNIHCTLKTNLLKRGDLEDIVKCYTEKKETERFKRFSSVELIQRDKLNLDIFWLKDDSRQDVDSLPPPHIIAAEIVENLQAALE